MVLGLVRHVHAAGVLQAHQEIPAPSDDDQSVMAAEGSGAEVPGGVEEMPPEENSEVRAVSASEVGSVATAAAAGGVAGLTAGGVASLAYSFVPLPFFCEFLSFFLSCSLSVCVM